MNLIITIQFIRFAAGNAQAIATAMTIAIALTLRGSV